MFRPLDGHAQATKVHKVKITNPGLFYIGRLKYQSLGVVLLIICTSVS